MRRPAGLLLPLLLAACASDPPPNPAPPPATVAPVATTTPSRAERRDLLAPLEAHMREPGGRQARLVFEHEGEGPLAQVDLAVDVPFTTLVVAMRAKDDAGKEFTQLQVVTKDGLRVWRQGDQRGTHLACDLAVLRDLLRAAASKVDAALGGTAPGTDAPTDMALDVTVTGHEEDARPRLVFGVRIGQHAAGWFDAIVGAEGCALLREADAWSFELPDDHKRLVLDPATGFFRSLGVTLADGERWTLRCEQLRRVDGAPEIPALPAEWDVQPLPMGLFEGLVRAAFGPLLEALSAQRDASDGAAEEKRVRVATALAATLSTALERQALQLMAHELVLRRLADGATRDELLSGLPALVGDLTGARSDLDPWLDEAEQELSQRHGLDPAAVAAEREKQPPDLEAILRAELR